MISQSANFDQQHSGDLVSRCTNDLNTLGADLHPACPYAAFWAGSRIGWHHLDLRRSTGKWAFSPSLLEAITTWVSTAIANPLRKKSAVIQETLGTLTQRLSDILQSLTVTKMFHLEETTHRHYAQVNQQTTAATIDHASTQATYDAINAFISWMRSIGTLAFGLYLLSNGHVGLGAIVAAIHLQGNASFMFTNLGDFVTGYSAFAGRFRTCLRVALLAQRTHEASATICRG